MNLEDSSSRQRRSSRSASRLRDSPSTRSSRSSGGTRSKPIAAGDGLDPYRLLARSHHLEVEVDRERVSEAAGSRASSQDAGKARPGCTGASTLRRRKAAGLPVLPDTPPSETNPDYHACTYLGDADREGVPELPRGEG